MMVFELVFWSILSVFAVFYLTYWLLMYWSLRRRKDAGLGNAFSPTVSIIIPTYNEEHVIRTKLDNTFQLEYPREKLQILIVDSGSTDRTQEKIQEFLRTDNGSTDLKNMNVTTVFEKQRRGKASALNKVLKLCQGDVVIITDADVRLESDSLSRIVAHFVDTNVGAVTGKVIVQSSGSFSTNVEKTYRGIFDILRQGESNLDSTPIFNGPLSAYRRELIDEIREDTVTDDIELAMNIRKKGFRTLYDDRAIFYERYPSTLRGRLKQKQRRAQGLVQSLLRHSSMIFRRSYGKYGSIILPSHFFMSIVSPILVLVLLLSFAISVFFMPAIFLVSALVLLLAAEGVSRLFSRMTGKKRLTPIGFIETFLDGQFSLLLGMLTLMYRTDYAWEKIEEIRQEPNLSTPIS